MVGSHETAVTDNYKKNHLGKLRPTLEANFFSCLQGAGGVVEGYAKVGSVSLKHRSLGYQQIIDPASFSQQFNAAWERVELDRFSNMAGTDLVAKSLYSYDPAGRMQTLSHLDAIGSVLANYQYTYDAAGELTQETHHGITFNYQYDKAGQLTSTTRSDQPPVVQSYDANGNLTDSGIVVGPDNRILADSQFTYQYDNEGNLTQKVNKSTGDITNYTYDFRNRLTDVTTTSSGGIALHSEQYTYDVFDRRIAVTVNGARRRRALMREFHKQLAKAKVTGVPQRVEAGPLQTGVEGDGEYHADGERQLAANSTNEPGRSDGRAESDGIERARIAPRERIEPSRAVDRRAEGKNVSATNQGYFANAGSIAGRSVTDSPLLPANRRSAKSPLCSK